MITLDKNTVAYSGTLVVAPTQVITISPETTGGFGFKLFIGEDGAMPISEDDMKKLVISGIINMDIPFLPNQYTMSYEVDAEQGGKSATIVIAAHGVGSRMVVHIQCEAREL